MWFSESQGHTAGMSREMRPEECPLDEMPGGPQWCQWWGTTGPFSRGPSQPRYLTHVSHIVEGFFIS